MGEAGADAVLLGATSSLRQFTGVAWHPSERFAAHSYMPTASITSRRASNWRRIGVPGEVIPGRFGVRHEDHFYMTANGPRWFTEPAANIDEPFANAPAFS